jgi:hypothetical protein
METDFRNWNQYSKTVEGISVYTEGFSLLRVRACLCTQRASLCWGWGRLCRCGGEDEGEGVFVYTEGISLLWGVGWGWGWGRLCVHRGRPGLLIIGFKLLWLSYRVYKVYRGRIYNFPIPGMEIKSIMDFRYGFRNGRNRELPNFQYENYAH